MSPAVLVRSILAGLFLIALGLIPGLFSRSAEGLAEGIRNFLRQIHGGFLPLPLSPRPVNDARPVRQPIWLAFAGAALIALSIWANGSK